MHLPSQESEQSVICFLEVSIFPLLLRLFCENLEMFWRCAIVVYSHLNTLSAISWREQVTFITMMMMMMMVTALYEMLNMLSSIFIVLAHWNNCHLVNMSRHSDTLSWFRSHLSLILLIYPVPFAEKEQVLI